MVWGRWKEYNLLSWPREKTIQGNNIKRLVLEDGSKIRDTNSMLKEQRKFYRKLYESRDDDRIEKWMESISIEYRKLNEDQKFSLEGLSLFKKCLRL